MIFYLTKTENRTKKLQHSSHTIALSKGAILPENAHFLQKNTDISKIKGILVLKGTFSETTYVCVFLA